jgi:hypothetical protein
MKKFNLIILVLVCLVTHVTAQNETEPIRYNKNGSFVSVHLTNGAFLAKGLLWKVTEDTLEFVNPEYRKQFYKKVPVIKIHYSELSELKTTPRGAIKKGMLAGAAIGFASGLAVGIGTTENPEPYTKTVTSGGGCFLIFCIPESTSVVEVDEPRDAGTVILKTLFLTSLGTFIGGILGNSAAIEEKTFGSKEKYQALVPELKKQAFWGTADVKTKKKN